MSQGKIKILRDAFPDIIFHEIVELAPLTKTQGGTNMVSGAAGAAGGRVSARRGQRRGRVRGGQRLAQRRGPALPEQPQHLLRRDRTLLAVRHAQVVRAVAEACCSWEQKDGLEALNLLSGTY